MAKPIKEKKAAFLKNFLKKAKKKMPKHDEKKETAADEAKESPEEQAAEIKAGAEMPIKKYSNLAKK